MALVRDFFTLPRTLTAVWVHTSCGYTSQAIISHVTHRYISHVIWFFISCEQAAQTLTAAGVHSSCAWT